MKTNCGKEEEKGAPISQKELNKLSRMAKDLNCADETECAILKEKLNNMGLKYFAVEKDGHCQFGAVLPHLNNKDFTVMDMRREVTYVLLQLLRRKDECEEYQLYYQLFTMECSEIKKSVKDYLHDLYTGEQWGDNLTARLICEIYKINLFVIFKDGGVFPIWKDNNFSKTVHVILLNQHYTGTEPNVVMRNTNDGNDTAESEIMAKVEGPIAIGEDENVKYDIDSTEVGSATATVEEVEGATTSDVENMVVDEQTAEVENEVTSTSSTVKPSKVSTRKRVYNKPNCVYCEVDGKFKCKKCGDLFNSARAACLHHECKHAENVQVAHDSKDMVVNEKIDEVDNTNVAEAEGSTATVEEVEGATTSDVENMVVDEDTTGVENEVTSTSSTVKPSKVSTRKRVYNKPNRVYCEVDGKFKCKKCGDPFNSTHAARLHHEHKHAETGNKEHKCSECGKDFNCKGNLTKHQKMCGKM